MDTEAAYLEELKSDPLIAALMKQVDRDAIRENLKLTHEQRLLKLQAKNDCLGSEKGTQRPSELKEVAPIAPLGTAAKTEGGSPNSEMRPEWLPYDPVIEAYKKDVDRTLLRETLKRTPAERALQLESMTEFIDELQKAGARMRAADKS